MTCNIQTGNGKIGLDESVYKQTPPAESDFKYSLEKEYNKEPENIIEEIKDFIANIGKLFVKKG